MNLQVIDLYVFLGPDEEDERLHLFRSLDAVTSHLHLELVHVFSEPNGQIEVSHRVKEWNDGLPILEELKKPQLRNIREPRPHFLPKKGEEGDLEIWKKRLGPEHTLRGAWEIVTLLDEGYAFPWGGTLLHFEMAVEFQSSKEPTAWEYKTLRLPPGEDRDVPINHWAAQGWTLMGITSVADGQLLAMMQHPREDKK